MTKFQVKCVSNNEVLAFVLAALTLPHTEGRGFASTPAKRSGPVFQNSPVYYVQVTLDNEILTITYVNDNPYREGEYPLIEFADAIRGIRLKDFTGIVENDVPVQFKLNDEYTASINKKGVAVGCQFFPMEVIKQFINEVNKVSAGVAK